MSIVKRSRALFAGLTVLIHPSVYHGVREQQCKLLGILLDGEANIVQSDTRSRIDIVLVDIGAYDPQHQQLRYADILDYTWVELCARRQCLANRPPFKFRPATSTPCNTRVFDPNVFYFVHGVEGYSGLLRNLRNSGACLCTNAAEADIILTYATQFLDAPIDCSKLTAKIVDFAWADLCIRSQRRVPYEAFLVKPEDSTKFDLVPIVVDDSMSEVDELMDDDDDPPPANPDDKPALDDRTLPSAGEILRISPPSKATSSKPAYLPVPPKALLKHLDRSKRSHGVKWTNELIDFVVEYYRAAWSSDPRRASKHIAAEIASKLPVSERSVMMWMERKRRAGVLAASFKSHLPSQIVLPRARSDTTQPVLHDSSRASNIANSAPPPSSSLSSRLSKCGTELLAPQLPVTIGKITCHSPSQGAVAHKFFEELLEWELVRDPDVGIYTICRRVDKTQVFYGRAFQTYWRDRDGYGGRAAILQRIRVNAEEMRQRGVKAVGDWFIAPPDEASSASDGSESAATDDVDMYDEPSEILDDTGLDVESDSEYPGVLTDEEASAMACYLDCLESSETSDRSSKRRAVWRWLTFKFPNSGRTAEHWQTAYRLQKKRVDDLRLQNDH